MPRRRNDRLDERHNSDNHRYNRWLRHLDSNMDRGAQRAIRMRHIVMSVHVDCLDSAAGNNQRDAHQRNKKPPKT
jgi:hypothetical protein